MAMQQDPIDWRYLPYPTTYVWPIFEALILGTIPAIHMALLIWYVYVPPSVGSWRSPIEVKWVKHCFHLTQQHLILEMYRYNWPNLVSLSHLSILEMGW